MWKFSMKQRGTREVCQLAQQTRGFPKGKTKAEERDCLWGYRVLVLGILQSFLNSHSCSGESPLSFKWGSTTHTTWLIFSPGVAWEWEKQLEFIYRAQGESQINTSKESPPTGCVARYCSNCQFHLEPDGEPCCVTGSGDPAQDTGQVPIENRWTISSWWFKDLSRLPSPWSPPSSSSAEGVVAESHALLAFTDQTSQGRATYQNNCWFATLLSKKWDYYNL